MESRAGSKTSRPPNPEFRVLRCFCGCSTLKFEEIEALTMMNVGGLVNNTVGKKLLHTFLAIGHRQDKSNITILLECYDLCERVSCDINTYEQHVDDLAEMCPSYEWEQRIVQSRDAETQLNTLAELKRECLSMIECDVDFHRFRRELRRKIGK